ncbi:MAG: restriction endonuclease subunit S [Lentisphaeria bacterium]|nr:restriction endonuclease subunit S [Lentisphaeria bacterium]
MNKDNTQHALVPRLRFPEFRGKPLYSICLGDVTAESKIRNGDEFSAASVMGVRKGEGIVPMEERLVASDISRYKLVQKNWFAYNPMRLNIGSIARHHHDDDILVSPDYVVFRCLEEGAAPELSPDYLDQFRESSNWDAFVAEAGDGGVRVRIYYSRLAELRLAVPDIAEQQKIAGSLGSLDDLIAAEGRKLEALRDHKKGLMQHLFPREGERQPRLRFPEFFDAPEWTEYRTECVCERIMDGTHFSPQSTDGPRPYLTSKNVRNGFLDLSTVTFISEEDHREIYARCPVQKHDVLLTKDGASTGNCVINNLDYEFSLLSSVAVLRGKVLKIVPAFLYYTIVSPRYRKQLFDSIAGQAITRITLTKLKNYTVVLPDMAEQQRIADCLTALDTWIAAQAEKLDALRTHKRGLMQQLFPSPEVS